MYSRAPDSLPAADMAAGMQHPADWWLESLRELHLQMPKGQEQPNKQREMPSAPCGHKV